MSLKPPKYLYLKAKESKIRIPGFTTIELTNNRKYKPKGYGSKAEWASPAVKWSDSWKQVLRLTQTGGFKLKDTKTQTIGKLSEGSEVCQGRYVLASAEKGKTYTVSVSHHPHCLKQTKFCNAVLK